MYTVYTVYSRILLQSSVIAGYFIPPGQFPSWTSWSEWTRCSKTCGVGLQTRRRRCRGGRQTCSYCRRGDPVDFRTCDTRVSCKLCNSWFFFLYFFVSISGPIKTIDQCKVDLQMKYEIFLLYLQSLNFIIHL